MKKGDGSYRNILWNDSDDYLFREEKSKDKFRGERNC